MRITKQDVRSIDEAAQMVNICGQLYKVSGNKVYLERSSEWLTTKNFTADDIKMYIDKYKGIKNSDDVYLK